MAECRELPSRVLGRVIPAAAFFVPLAVYLRTLARDVVPGDGGELAAAAVSLGIAHPPGYPAFVLAGRALSLVPFGPAFFRVGLLSALTAAGATWLIYRTAARLDRRAPVSGLLAGALLFAFAGTTWSQATTVEVYSLQALLIAAFFWAALAAPDAPDAPDQAQAQAQAHDNRRRALVGFFCGLSLTNHTSGLLLAPSLLLWLAGEAIRTRREGRPWWSAMPRPLVWILPPLLLYLYLPIRSRMNPAVNWDHPETWHRFLVHVTAGQYHGNLGREGLRLEELRRFLFEQLPGEATVFLPILSIVGIFRLARTRPRVLLLTAPFLITVLLFNAAYPIHDIRVYYIPALLVLTLWAASGAGWLGESAQRMGRPAAAVATIALLAVPVLAATRNFTSQDRRDDQLVSTYARDCVRWADPGAVLFSGDWDRFSAPFLYLQLVEGLRSDLIVVDMGRISSPTFERSIRRPFPDLADACETEIAGGAALARAAERGKRYDIASARRTYRGLQRALVRQSVLRRPTYAVGEAYLHPMYSGYYRYPEGLLVRLTLSAADRPFPPPDFEGPATSGSDELRPEERDLVEDYRRALDRRIHHAEVAGRAEEAAALKGLMEQLPR